MHGELAFVITRSHDTPEAHVYDNPLFWTLGCLMGTLGKGEGVVILGLERCSKGHLGARVLTRLGLGWMYANRLHAECESHLFR